MEPAEELYEALAYAQRLGFLGPRPIPEVVDHAMAFVAALEGVTGEVIDLGSGGGVPGLVIAAARPDLRLVLLDRRTKRTDFLDRVVRRCGWADRVSVYAGDASELVRSGRAVYAAAVARGFGPPEKTLTIGAALVQPGGLVVISEPPSGDRWDPWWLVTAGAERAQGPAGVAVFRRSRI